MPLYEYKCDTCGENFELIRTIKDRDNALCPKCNKGLERQLSSCNWSFGWVLNDRCHEIGTPKEEFVKNV